VSALSDVSDVRLSKCIYNANQSNAIINPIGTMSAHAIASLKCGGKSKGGTRVSKKASNGM